MRFAEELRATLPAGSFGEVLYVYDTIGSTNTRALELASAGAAHGTLVVADHQSRGRGRGAARWHTPAGSAVAMSLILRPSVNYGLRWSGLAALAVTEALLEEGLAARIKWPNDVLVGGRKVAGVLVEGAWEGERPLHVVVGVGINVGRESVPDEQSLAFPATSVELEARRTIPRPRLMMGVIRSLEKWNARLASQAFLETWQERLAFKGERVLVGASPRTIEGRLVGLGPQAEARIELDNGEIVLAGREAGRLRPLPRPARDEPPPARRSP